MEKKALLNAKKNFGVFWARFRSTLRPLHYLRSARETAGSRTHREVNIKDDRYCIAGKTAKASFANEEGSNRENDQRSFEAGS